MNERLSEHIDQHLQNLRKTEESHREMGNDVLAEQCCVSRNIILGLVDTIDLIARRTRPSDG